MQAVTDWRPDLRDGGRQTATGCRPVKAILSGSALNVHTSRDFVVDIDTAVASGIPATLVTRVHQEMPRSRASVDAQLILVAINWRISTRRHREW